MEIKIIERKENPLLNRTEIKFECEYPAEGTPKILDVKHKLVALEDSSNDLLVVDSMKPSYGVTTAVGLAKVYDSVEKLNEIETKSVIAKNEEPEEEPAEETEDAE
ncbi:30S ribosomal protein S24e [Candidatus Methanosphaera massiliense]|jgi:small subunit ribosomal protein S24e|uniref:30S ribosomal protein S24e n=1 Tax=Methanosphaera TaxID=2316 RepID=UPI000DC516B5|nr:30S ribosomal protein S24e [Candidatus Methanosphaera massiliense]MDD6286475.1 30S ribosomal protein S24e [Methanobacteriaceae archaeon]MDE4078886.1 30S ribosomal protein S24e [Candidatus Methanosphaera massiliense]MDY2744625.1 30S ribosomal protein S24e [Methanosphaera sp.]RAP44989.1 MAG: 30S ribosomal protein S24e [Methanosphaera sp. SHI1033]